MPEFQHPEQPFRHDLPLPATPPPDNVSSTDATPPPLPVREEDTITAPDYRGRHSPAPTSEPTAPVTPPPAAAEADTASSPEPPSPEATAIEPIDPSEHMQPPSAPSPDSSRRLGEAIVQLRDRAAASAAADDGDTPAAAPSPQPVSPPVEQTTEADTPTKPSEIGTEYIELPGTAEPSSELAASTAHTGPLDQRGPAEQSAEAAPSVEDNSLDTTDVPVTFDVWQFDEDVAPEDYPAVKAMLDKAVHKTHADFPNFVDPSGTNGTGSVVHLETTLPGGTVYIGAHIHPSEDGIPRTSITAMYYSPTADLSAYHYSFIDNERVARDDITDIQGAVAGLPDIGDVPDAEHSDQVRERLYEKVEQIEDEADMGINSFTVGPEQMRFIARILEKGRPMSSAGTDFVDTVRNIQASRHRATPAVARQAADAFRGYMINHTTHKGDGDQHATGTDDSTMVATLSWRQDPVTEQLEPSARFTFRGNNAATWADPELSEHHPEPEKVFHFDGTATIVDGRLMVTYRERVTVPGQPKPVADFQSGWLLADNSLARIIRNALYSPKVHD